MVYHAEQNTPAEVTNHFINIDVTFTREDCPPSITNDMMTPLMVTPTISNTNVRCTLVDGGSSLNLLFASILNQMQIPRSKIKNISIPFYGIAPGSSVTPIGQVLLSVTFGTTKNFRTELITFDLVDAELPYNAILGRPALIKFMAVDHYAYKCLKIPGLNNASP